MDAYKRGNAYYVEMDLPGVQQDNIDLTIEGKTVTVRALRHSNYDGADEVVIAERPSGQFTRQLVLGERLDTQSLQASYDSGMLRIIIPLVG